MIYKILPLILTVVLVIAQRDRFGREHAIGLGNFIKTYLINKR